jgi:hypothetical protein
MPAEDVTVTAHFVGPLDHFTVYDVDWETAPVIEEDVYLEDQFGAVSATVLNAVAFCNAAQKVHGDIVTPISNPDHHLTIYEIEYPDEPQQWQVLVENQFGVQDLTVWGPIGLAVPTQKEGHEAPLRLDHYLVYSVIPGPYTEVIVEVEDQFGDPIVVTVYQAIYFANPVKKTHGDITTDIFNPDDHFVIYQTNEGPFDKQVGVANQFGDQILDISGPNYLAVPSQKLDFALAVGHFKTYQSMGPLPPVGEEVVLEDQFGSFEAVADWPMWFCNPADKWHMGIPYPMPDPDYHLTVYHINVTGGPKEWAVGVTNQFGEEQHLTVSGPVALAVPTHKLFPNIHQPPVGLDHYLIYEVVEGTAVDASVELYDEFGPDPEVVVTLPRYFANPVKKTHGAVTFDIVNERSHLVFYEIAGATVWYPEVGITNQFVAEESLSELVPAFLTVPSWKLYVDPMF